jgi:Ca-activated chloride channel family protein
MSFVRASNPNDEVFVVNFGDRVSYGLPASVPFSGSIPQLRAALALGTPAGRTALYDGVISSLGHLEAGKRDKKTLVVISDGGDNSSVNGSEELMLAVRESRATIYTIGIFDEGDPDQNPALLRRLARISGGSAYFPQSIDDVTGVCREIARDIRLRYTIGYVPIPSAARSSLRKIDVVAKGPNGHKLVSLTRRSYSLPDSDQQRGAARKPGS